MDDSFTRDAIKAFNSINLSDTSCPSAKPPSDILTHYTLEYNIDVINYMVSCMCYNSICNEEIMNIIVNNSSTFNVESLCIIFVWSLYDECRFNRLLLNDIFKPITKSSMLQLHCCELLQFIPPPSVMRNVLRLEVFDKHLFLTCMVGLSILHDDLELMHSLTDTNNEISIDIATMCGIVGSYGKGISFILLLRVLNPYASKFRINQQYESVDENLRVVTAYIDELMTIGGHVINYMRSRKRYFKSISDDKLYKLTHSKVSVEDICKVTIKRIQKYSGYIKELCMEYKVPVFRAIYLLGYDSHFGKLITPSIISESYLTRQGLIYSFTRISNGFTFII